MFKPSHTDFPSHMTVQKQAEGGKWPGPPREALALSEDMLEDESGSPA